MTHVKDWAVFYGLIFLFVIFYFIFNGFTTIPWEGDSLAYHIPLAEHLTRGQFSGFDNLLYYYPASIHVLLALFMVLNLPLQLFNVVGSICLFFSLTILGTRFGLEKQWSIVYAVTIATLTPMMRLIGTQTIDIYLAAFYALTLALLVRPQRNLLYSLNLGIVGGMLVGGKYTGPLFALLLVPFFLQRVVKKVSHRGIIIFIFAVTAVGGSWYLRNLFLMGDLTYPAHHPDFTWLQWHTWQTIFQKEGGVYYFLESLFSEYLIWAISIVVLPYMLIRKQLNVQESRFVLIGIVNFIIHLLIPASPDNVLSDMRYTVPTFICLLLVVFSYAQRQKKQTEVALFSIIPLLSSFTLVIPHRPKLFVIFSGMVVVGYLIKKKNPRFMVGS